MKTSFFGNCSVWYFNFHVYDLCTINNYNLVSATLLFQKTIMMSQCTLKFVMLLFYLLPYVLSKIGKRAETGES